MVSRAAKRDNDGAPESSPRAKTTAPHVMSPHQKPHPINQMIFQPECRKCALDFASVIPAQLAFLTIYNPLLGPTDETIQDQIVFYTSRSDLLKRRESSTVGDETKDSNHEWNERLRQIGLAQGIVSFARNFSEGKSVDYVETDKSHIILHELEENWWILALVDMTRLPADSSKAPSSQRNISDAPQYHYSSREMCPPHLLIQQLRRAHSTFLLHHDFSLESMYQRIGRPAFCTILDSYWRKFAWNWEVLLSGNPAIDMYNGIKLSAGGELGVGVGEEEWGSGEREVLEDFVSRTDGLVDLIVSRFGDPYMPEQEKARGLPSQPPKGDQWLGLDVYPRPSDGVVFSGPTELAKIQPRPDGGSDGDDEAELEEMLTALLASRIMHRLRAQTVVSPQAFLVHSCPHPRVEALKQESSSGGDSQDDPPGDQGMTLIKKTSHSKDRGNFLIGLLNDTSNPDGQSVEEPVVTNDIPTESNEVISQRTLHVHPYTSDQDITDPVKLRTVVYVNQPFMYTFLFDPETPSLADPSLYHTIHHQLGPLQKPLSHSTSPANAATRISESEMTTDGNQLVAPQTQPVYDLVYDPSNLTIRSSIPNIPDLGPEPLGNHGSSSPPWSRVESLNIHHRILSTFVETRSRPLELERTCKTSRGWWVVWVRMANAGTADQKDSGAASVGTDDPRQEAFLIRKASDHIPPSSHTRNSSGTQFFRDLGGVGLGFKANNDAQAATMQAPSCWNFSLVPKYGLLLIKAPSLPSSHNHDYRPRTTYAYNMTTQYYPAATRPPGISELIKRLQKNTLDARESEALRALCQTAVKQVLNGTNIPTFAWEAARLAEVVPEPEFMQLLWTFVNSISTGTQDRTSLDPFHLRCLAYVVRQRRLEFACQQNDQQAQYELICTLGLVLDAMADIGISKLSRESLHQPLLKLLKDLKGDKELHLSQAAVYAGQALLGISDDDTLLDASLRGALRVVDLALMTFGAVSSHDLHKSFEATKGAFAGARDLKDYAQDAFKARRGCHWYMALRMTDILLRSRSIDKLVEFIEIATRDIKSGELLCGLYAQLEQGEEHLSPEDFKRIYDAIPGSKSDRVRAWARYLTEGRGYLQPNQVGELHSVHPPVDRSDYKWALDPFFWKASPGEHSESASRNLMDQVYQKCDTARRFYAKNALLQHYSRNENERLNIQRVNGRLLPMDRCYINLAIVDRGKSGQIVTLPTLFDTRKRDHANTIQPRRIFIEGQAGVGKTTLCKKLVHDYIYQGQWQDRFDWLLWIPLRNLRGTRSRSYNLEHFFRDEYFSLHRDRDLLAETLFKVSLNRSSRVLFVLDGLDEISRDLSADDPMEGFIYHLLEQPQVIATSRPFYLRCLDRMKPDLELRTTGFDLKQIRSYVHTLGITPNDETANKIWSFIQVYPRIRDFVQIPALLDTLCYCWSDTVGNFNDAQLEKAMTMTDIYESLTMKLLMKDFRRCKQGPLNDDDLKGDHIVEDLMHDETNLLEGLAFHGMLNDVFEFDAAFREQVYRHLGAQRISIPGLPEKALKGLSFLRTSDKDVNQDKKKFHFLHRTVQEHFAGRLFMKHWVWMRDIYCLVLQQEDKELKSSLRYDVRQISPREFLEDGKYNLRYDMIWRFVTGLLRRPWNQIARKKPLLE
ncbi:hypothetical protein HFD88_001566 [Aspergillus terreus]|nr:hypothetical protein HFD88_001566 [Aspergillus terreus]